MHDRLDMYLQDPLLKLMYEDLERAGPLKAILVDITHVCNLRCKGCYFFEEDMDRFKSPEDEAVFDAFIASEKARGTNFVTVVGGEPSLQLERLKKLHDSFWVTAVTNGIHPIPYQGFENMPVGLSVWGDHETDTYLRGNNKIPVFRKALDNYRDDPRAIWYYTTTPKNAHEIASVVEQCVANGNYVTFNFYGDISGLGGAYDHRDGFALVRREIDRAIERFPDKILASSYISQVVSTGQLFDESWGYDVCCSITPDNPINRERIANGNPYNPHFRAYNPDLATTRRCCVGDERDCGNCYDVYAHISWIMMNLGRHLRSKEDFTHWLTTMYIFYLGNRILDLDARIHLLPEIHARSQHWREHARTSLPGLGLEHLPADLNELVEEVL